MWWLLEHFLAGIWPMLFKYGVFVFAIGCALAFAWFSPVFKKTALWVASGIAIGLVCYHTGVSDGSNRVTEQWDAALAREAEIGAEVLRDAKRDAERVTPRELREHPWNRDNHAKPDTGAEGGGTQSKVRGLAYWGFLGVGGQPANPALVPDVLQRR